MEEKYILVSLEDDKAKKIANIISNDTCRKILDYLASKDASETEISKDLNLPLSTVHYNLSNLNKNGLVEIKDFSWSEKGNKINVYKIAKKFIVISPKGSNPSSFFKNLLPVALISATASFLVYVFSGSQVIPISSDIFPPQEANLVAAKTMADTVASGLAQESAVAVSTTSVIQNVNLTIPSHNWIYFLLGSIFAMIMFMLFFYTRRKK